MSVRAFYATIKPQEAAEHIKNWVLQKNISGILVDEYKRTMNDKEIIVLVLEKYYLRSSNRASLTVTLDNMEGRTKVHAVASGSSESIIRFDWGASKNFAKSVEDSLAPYIVGGLSS